MNPFVLKNFKQYAIPLLLSFLGYFIGYVQQTNTELGNIKSDMANITTQISTSSGVLQRIEAKVDGLSEQVDLNAQHIIQNSEAIKQLDARVTILEEKAPSISNNM